MRGHITFFSVSHLELLFLFQDHADPVCSPPGKVLLDWSHCADVTWGSLDVAGVYTRLFLLQVLRIAPS